MRQSSGVGLVFVGAAIGYFSMHFGLLRGVFALLQMIALLVIAYDLFLLATQDYFPADRSLLVKLYSLLRADANRQLMAAFLSGFLLTASWRVLW